MAVSEKVTLACLPNRVPEANDVTSAGYLGTLDPANVQSLDLGDVFRSKYRSARRTYVQAEWTSPYRSKSLESAAFMGNLSESALYRFRAGSTAPTSLWERMAPTARVSYNRATADDGVSAPDYTEVDEDCDTALTSPDGGTRLPPGSLGAEVIYSFNPPSGTLHTGSPTNEFRVIASKQAAGLTDGFSVAVYESGSPVSGLSWAVLADEISEDLAEYVFQWDADDLATASGANVEIRLSTGGSTGTVDILIEACEWNAYKTGAGGASYDSGVVSAYDTFASQQFSDAAISDGFTGVNWLFGKIFDQEYTGIRYLLLEVWDRDLSSRLHPTYGATSYHVESWLPTEIYWMGAGPVYVPTYGMLHGWSMSPKDYGITKHNLVGSSIERAKFKKRRMAFTLDNLASAEAYQNLFLWLGLYAGKTKPFVIFPAPTQTGIQTLQNMLVKLTADIDMKDIAATDALVGASIQAEEW